MSRIKVSREELLAALNELGARASRSDFVTVEVLDRKLVLTDTDDYDNIIEAILFEDQNLQAQFRHSERLLYMKNKKRI